MPRPALTPYLARVTHDEAMTIFRETGALLDGHFILRSGLRSRQYFQCAQALQQMPVVEKLGTALAERLSDAGAKTILAPAMGGLVIGQEVARQLALRYIFVEKEDGKLALRRGFQIETGEPIIIVEDVITRGGRAREAMDIVTAHGGDLRAVAVVVDRSNGAFAPGVPLHSLMQLEVETFEPGNLPDDLALIEPVHPGS